MIYETLPVNCYKGNSNATTFDFDFYIENKNQLKVTLLNKDNTREVLNLDTDYSISEIKNKNGSNITYPLETSRHEVLKEDETILLELNLPICQEVQYNNSSLLNLETLEYSLDYLTRLIQILNRKIALCLKVEENINATPDSLLEGIQTSLNSCQNFAQQSNSYKNEAQNALGEVTSLKSSIEETKTEIEENQTELEEVLSSKTDKTQAARASMPSNNYIDLELGASGTKYTAPANGWVYLSLHSATASFSYIKSVGGYIAPKITQQLMVPVTKDENFTVTYGTNDEQDKVFRFYYAEGEV